MNSRSFQMADEDIDSKIADFMADIDEIVLGKNTRQETSEWKQCFDETSQSIYYWNTKSNECSWDRPELSSEKKRAHTTHDRPAAKKPKKGSLIAEYTSSDSEETVDEIDELLNEVMEKPATVNLTPPFETDYRAAIARLTSLGDRSSEILRLRVQLETRLDDALAGHLSKSYAVKKLEEALPQIDAMEKSSITAIPELTSNEMALLLSLPPPPPPPSPPAVDDSDLQLFYAQLNADQPETDKSSKPVHQHKEKKAKPSKTLPTDLIQKWTHAQQELRGIGDLNES